MLFSNVVNSARDNHYGIVTTLQQLHDVPVYVRQEYVDTDQQLVTIMLPQPHCWYSEMSQCSARTGFAHATLTASPAAATSFGAC